jgi:VacB/RNase II family 3'-5' exoribonuclease
MSNPSNNFNFAQAARAEVLREGFQPDFPPAVLAEVKNFTTAAPPAAARDLRSLLWSSIDNVDSRDLDQVEWAEHLPNDSIRVFVGIADVDAVVHPGSATDEHARHNATSVYPGGPVFPMLPERLSTDLTSLRQDEDRAAVIMEFVVAPDGEVTCADVFAATLRNHAKLNYDEVGKWLDTQAGAPSCEIATPPGLCDQLHVQQEAAKRLKRFRLENGALTLGGVESVPLIADNQVQQFAILQENSARDIIESFMIAANVAMARHLRAKKFPCLRRVVRTPKRWDRIVEIAAQYGIKLPAQPDPRPLGEFLSARQKTDPARFPELSLAVLKAMGPGEYIVEHPGTEQVGHFGLALNDYTHSTAPNRRYADLVVQRLLKASLSGTAQPYSEGELSTIAAQCTDREAAARKVERFMHKVAAAAMLAPQIGQQFDAIVTGATAKGTFVRLLTVPAEGRIIRGEKGLDVGDKLRVRLTGVNPNLGFIDFERVSPHVS